jgi:hypothetical protein
MASNGAASSTATVLRLIELYNPTPQAVNLAGWHLTDEQDNPDKGRFHPCRSRFSIPANFWSLASGVVENH